MSASAAAQGRVLDDLLARSESQSAHSRAVQLQHGLQVQEQDCVTLQELRWAQWQEQEEAARAASSLRALEQQGLRDESRQEQGLQGPSESERSEGKTGKSKDCKEDQQTP